MEEENFIKLVNMLPYIVFGGAAFLTLLYLLIDFIIHKINQP